MAYHKIPNRDEYDVVVVGSGMGGLSAAVGLASRGLDVLVVEAHYRAGGLAHSFVRHKRLAGQDRASAFEFDSAVHLTPGGGRGEGLHKLLISNADACQTFLEMVGREHLEEEFAESLVSRPLSISAFEVFLAVDTDLKSQGVMHETFFAPGHDPEEVYDNHAAGRIFGCGLSIPTIEDETVAPPGLHTVCITMFAPWDRDWKREKAALTEGLIDEAERVVPGLRRGLVFQDSGTPTTIQRYTGNRQGAIYGWDSSPKSLATRLAMETPVPGLFLAGHWTRPGGGLYAVVTSGQIAAERVFHELEQGGRARCVNE
jgi:phytoene dehydrogenase-like protein